MTGFMSVFKREVKSYFATPVAYVFLTIFLAGSAGFAFKEGFAKGQQATMRPFFENMPFLLLFLVPAIAMRLWSEERRSRSIELLFALPITTTQAVLAKFLAAWSVMTLALALTFPMVMTLNYLSTPDWGPIIGGYVACFLMAGTYVAIGSFFSALTRNQVIAFVLTVVVGAVFIFADSLMVLDAISSKFSTKLADMVGSVSFMLHFEALQRGVIEIRNLLYFVIITVGWLIANVIILEERKSA
jgi:ABC-2 type transport system permease protein